MNCNSTGARLSLPSAAFAACVVAGIAGCEVPQASAPAAEDAAPVVDEYVGAFAGAKAGEERAVAGVRLCWCPAGRFTMGSPPEEPERRPGENQVEVTITKGFWIGKYELTQAEWKRFVGEFPGKLNAGEGVASRRTR
jgi:formylglycine-generating enzyme required for sulfatase activity